MTVSAPPPESLPESEERFRLLVEGIPDYGIFMLDPQGLVASWNVGAQRIKGYTEDEVLGRHFSMFYPEPARAAGHPDHELELAAQFGRYEEEEWRVRKDGSLFWANVMITAMRNADGTLRGFSKVTRDLTEAHKRDEALRLSEERLRRAFNDAPTGVALVDLSGRYVQVNQALATLTGYTSEQLLTMSFQDHTHPDCLEQDTDALEQLVTGEIASYVRDKRYLWPDGQVVWVSVHVVPVTDAYGAVTGLLTHVLDLTQRHLYERHLVELAQRDSLTGLANRARFHELLTAHIDHCRRYGPTGAVLMLDLDNFKRVNDSLGHNAGDELIISTAATLRDRLRSADVLARLGGDEFAVLLPQATREQAELVAANIADHIRGDVVAFNGERKRTVTISIGIVMIEDPSLTSAELLGNADLAMYDAKEAGRDRIALYATANYPMPQSKARQTWAQRIEDALENNGFELWAQPILDLRTDEVTSHELLLRMRGAGEGLIEPGRFLYIAERMGLIGEIDRWVTTQAVQLLHTLQQTRPGHRLEVNISGLSVGDEGLRTHLAHQVANSGIDPSGLIFEITETAAVQRIHAAREFADSLREIGCSFALDDFGAGFGSFYYLKHLPFDYVKIDGEFVANCTSNLTDRLVIEAVVGIAKGLDKQTIAEFVGDAATQDFLREQGVDHLQGYHVGKPVPIRQAFPDVAAIGEVMPGLPLPRPADPGDSPRTTGR